MNVEDKKNYIREKYTELANSILALINTDEKVEEEVRLGCYRLWLIYHFLNDEILYMSNVIQDKNQRTRRHRLRPCSSCEFDYSSRNSSTSSPVEDLNRDVFD